MKAFCIIILNFVIIFQGFNYVKCDFELKLLNVLFRHGDKVPHKEYQNYPNDPHFNETYFPMGSGGLTNIGKIREYNIGKLLRNRYNEFIGSYYWPDLIYGRSTDIPRTQMSLQLVLAGLFPPIKQQLWNFNISWQPVSVVSVPYQYDSLLFSHHCPEYIKEYKTFLKQKNTKKMIEKHSHIMKYLSEHTGKNIDTTSAVYYLYNLFKEQASENLTLPEWTNKIYPNSMKEITIDDFNLRSYTTPLKRLNGGPLLREITENIKSFISETLKPPSRKVFLYSAHELNVAALSRSLGIKEPLLPEYGSTLLIETLQDEHKKYYIRILLWTGVSEQLVIQKIPECQELCPIDDFINILHEVIPSKSQVDNCYNEMYDQYHQHHHQILHKKISKSSSSSSSGYNNISINLILLIIIIIFII